MQASYHDQVFPRARAEDLLQQQVGMGAWDKLEIQEEVITRIGMEHRRLAMRPTDTAVPHNLVNMDARTIDLVRQVLALAAQIPTLQFHRQVVPRGTGLEV